MPPVAKSPNFATAVKYGGRLSKRHDTCGQTAAHPWETATDLFLPLEQKEGKVTSGASAGAGGGG